jgi:hypothetical protein
MQKDFRRVEISKNTLIPTLKFKIIVVGYRPGVEVIAVVRGVTFKVGHRFDFFGIYARSLDP